MKFLLVFLSMMLADVCWTMYFKRTAKNDAIGAASWNAAIILCGAFTVVEYTSDHWLLMPAIAGGFIGTYATVRWSNK